MNVSFGCSKKDSYPSKQISNFSKQNSHLSKQTSHLSKQTSHLSKQTSHLSKQTSHPLSKLKKGIIELPSGLQLNTYIATTIEEQTQGLSGIKKGQFSKNQSMIFIYPNVGYRGFWMANTYFNLDIIFLDENFKILHLEKNAPAHPTLKNPNKIYQTNVVSCRYVLEIRSDSKASKEIRKNITLKWISKPSLLQTTPNTHLSK